MRVRSLTVENFRNLTPQRITFDSQSTILVGRNGQGKTSLLEAIYLLAQARSFRAGKLTELASWGHGDASFVVQGEIETASGTKEIRVELKRGRRHVAINGNQVTAAEMFYGEAAAIEFTPDDLLIIKGMPAGRRTFIDRILSMFDRNFVGISVHYARALKHRNLILNSLRRARREAASNDGNVQEQLEPWERLLARYGSVIAEGRRDFIVALAEDVTEIYRALASSAPHPENIRLTYVSEFLSEQAVLSEGEILERYQERRGDDLRHGSTGFGPHRDELAVNLDVGAGYHPARNTASQGQIRSIALALKIAATRHLNTVRGEPPILLLDDVESELDSARRAALQELIRSLNSQVIITATELSPEVNRVAEGAGVLAIFDGQITPGKSPDFRS